MNILIFMLRIPFHTIFCFGNLKLWYKSFVSKLLLTLVFSSSLKHKKEDQLSSL